MDNVGDDEPDPIRLKSIKNNKTFTVPQSDRVRNNQLAIVILVIVKDKHVIVGLLPSLTM